MSANTRLFVALLAAATATAAVIAFAAYHRQTNPPPPHTAAAALLQEEEEEDEKSDEEEKPAVLPPPKPPLFKKASSHLEEDLTSTKTELAQKESALGTKAFKSGSYSTSVEHFTRAIDLCPETDLGKKVMLNNRAAAREKLLEWSETVSDCTLALEIDPQYRRALVRRAKALEAQTDFAAALTDLTLVRQLDAANGEEENAELLQSFDRVTKQIGNTHAALLWREKKEQQRIPPGAELKLPQNLNSVRQYYYSFSQEAGMFRSPPSQSQVLASTEQLRNADAEAVLALAQMHKFRLELNEAFDLFKQAGAHKAASKQVKSEALCEQASLLHLCGDFLSARERLDQAQALHPTVRGGIKLALLAVEDGDFELAKQLTGRVEAKDVHEIADLGFHQAAIACIELGDLTLAKELLERALQGVPDYGLAHMQLGIIHYRLGNTEDALLELEQSCLLLPELAEVHNFHGEVLMSLGHREEAIAKFMDATNADKHCALPLLNRGVLFMQKEDPSQAPSEEDMKQALELFDLAVQVDPSSEIAYVHRASYYGLLGNLDEALRNYERAIELAKSLTDLQEYCSFRAACQAQRAIQQKFAQPSSPQE